MKGLFEFADGMPVKIAVPSPESTCVVAEAVGQQAHPNGAEQASRVYLGSEEGFENYCRECWKLLMVQETEFQVFSIRVFCQVEKCVK